VQAGVGICDGLTYFTWADSFIFKAFNLLIRVAILALAAIDDSIE